MTGRGSPHERLDRARAWLGSSAQGGDRLARIFEIGRVEREVELRRELVELREKVDALEAELQDLHRLEKPTVELRRPPEPGERDYELHRCQGFEVYAGPELLGVVEGVVYGARPDRPDLLELRSRRFGRRSPLLVSVDEIEAIQPDEAVVVVREALRSTGSRRRLAAAVARLRSSSAQ
jgi:hypothetical protein